MVLRSEDEEMTRLWREDELARLCTFQLTESGSQLLLSLGAQGHTSHKKGPLLAGNLGLIYTPESSGTSADSIL